MNLQTMTMYEACLLHSRAERVLKGMVSDILKQWGITRMEWLVLATAAQEARAADGLTMGELAGILDIKLSQLNVLVSKMTGVGYLELTVADHDRRIKYVQATEQGESLLRDVEGNMRRGMRAWLSNLDRDDLATYLDVLQQLGAADDVA